jgi:hypothetical protein
MRFMMLMIPKGYETADANALPSKELIAAMSKYNEDLVKSGVLLALEGLHHPAKAKRLVFAGRKATVIDGPFTEAKEAVGGFWLIQVKSQAEALEWAARCPAQDGDVIELRQVQDLSDFPAEDLPKFSPELSALSPR